MKRFVNLSIYTIAGFFAAAVNFFLLPVLSHYLSPNDYGLIALVNNYVSVIAPFVSFLAYSFLSVQYFKVTEKTEFASLFSSIQIIPILPSIILMLVLTVFYNFIAPALELPLDKNYLAVVISLTAVFITYVETANAYLIMSQRPTWFLGFTIFRVLIESLLTVYLVIYRNMGWEGRIYSWFVSQAISTMLSFFIFYKSKLLSLRIKKKYILAGLAFGIPLIGHEIGKYLINQSNRLFIAKMISVDEAGIYNVGATVASVMMILITALSNFFTPKIMASLTIGTHDAKVAIVRASIQFLGLTILGFIGVNFATPILFKYAISKTYSNGINYVPWISFGYLFWGGYLIFVSYVFYFHKTRFLALLAIVNIIISVVFNYIFIKFFGGIGAAFASLLSYFVIMVIIIYYASRLIKLPWKEGISSLLVYNKNKV